MSEAVYRQVTETISNALAAGTVPWVRPWANTGQGGSLPFNASTGNHYKGSNTILLWLVQAARGYSSNGWLTFKQVQSLGGKVRAGEKAARIVFSKSATFKGAGDDSLGSEDESTRFQKWFLTTWAVFNTDQCEGLPKDIAPPVTLDAQWSDTDGRDTFFRSVGVDVRHGGNAAFYSPTTDHVQMPLRSAFESDRHWYATLAHEFAHWTGAASRLDRDSMKRYRANRPLEEMTAEIAAAFVMARLGDTLDGLRHADYVASWLAAMSEDSRAFMVAASQAQKAADYIFDAANKRGRLDVVDKPVVDVDTVRRPVIVAAKPVDPVQPVESVSESVAKPVDPVTHDNATVAAASLKQVTRKAYRGAFPLSESQARLYCSGAGHASGYWTKYFRDQQATAWDKRFQSRADRLMVDHYVRLGRVPDAGSVTKPILDTVKAELAARATWAVAAE